MTFPAVSRRCIGAVVMALVVFAPARRAAAVGSSFSLTNDGAWTWFNDPRAIIDGISLLPGWVTLSGHIMAGRFDLTPHPTTTADLYGQFFQSDDPDNPAFLKNPDGTYTAFFAPHGGASVRLRNFSLNPNGSFSLGSLSTLSESSQVSGSNGWAYANPYPPSS